jgi:hypothetical protein
VPPKKGGELARPREGGDVLDARRKRGGSNGADAGNGHQTPGCFISFGDGQNSLIALPDLDIEFAQLAHTNGNSAERTAAGMMSLPSMTRVAKARALFGPWAAMIPISVRWLRRVEQLGASAHQKFAHLMVHERRLVLDRSHRHKTH